MRTAPPKTSRLLILLALLASAGGCHKSIFDAREPRTQFETYDRMRQRHVVTEEPDVFGNPQPALRARLQHTQ